MEARRVLFAPVDELSFGSDGVLGVEVAEGEAGANAMPDFTMVDINPASTRYNQSISPRDYLEQVSGWYFGHST